MKNPNFTRQELKDAVPFKQDRNDRDEACLWTGAFVNSEAVNRMKAIIADDSFAITFQTMGQYRSALLKILSNKEA